MAAGANVRTFDPEATDNVKAIYGEKITFCDDQYTALDGADALAIMTEWSVFRTPNFDRMKESLNSPVIFDGRNLYDLRRMVEAGFYYDSIGRGVVG